MKYTNVSSFEETTEVFVHPVEENLHVFKILKKRKKISSDGSMKVPTKSSKQETQGFIDSENLEKLVGGKSYSTRKDMTILLQEGREIMRTIGYLFNIPDDKPEKKILMSSFKDKPYDEFVENQITTDDIVILKHDTHMLHDWKGDVLPVAMHFDYIDARMNNKSYDLVKAVEILLNRDDIYLYKKHEYRDGFVNEMASSVDEAITDIPYYNLEPDMNKMISFRWHPSVSDYRKMWGKCIEIGGQYPSTNKFRAIFELDLLGLRKSALSDNFYF